VLQGPIGVCGCVCVWKNPIPAELERYLLEINNGQFIVKRKKNMVLPNQLSNAADRLNRTKTRVSSKLTALEFESTAAINKKPWLRSNNMWRRSLLSGGVTCLNCLSSDDYTKSLIYHLIKGRRGHPICYWPPNFDGSVV
jgi:hypothetical protein